MNNLQSDIVVGAACSWCGAPKSGLQTGLCITCGRFGPSYSPRPLGHCLKHSRNDEFYALHTVVKCHNCGIIAHGIAFSGEFRKNQNA